MSGRGLCNYQNNDSKNAGGGGFIGSSLIIISGFNLLKLTVSIFCVNFAWNFAGIHPERIPLESSWSATHWKLLLFTCKLKWLAFWDKLKFQEKETPPGLKQGFVLVKSCIVFAVATLFFFIASQSKLSEKINQWKCFRIAPKNQRSCDLTLCSEPRRARCLYLAEIGFPNFWKKAYWIWNKSFSNYANQISVVSFIYGSIDGCVLVSLESFHQSDQYNLHVAAINSEHFQDIFDHFETPTPVKVLRGGFWIHRFMTPLYVTPPAAWFPFKVDLGSRRCWLSSRSWCLTGSWQIQLWSRFDCFRSAGASPESNEVLFSHITGSYLNSYVLFIGRSGNNALRGLS